MPSQTIYDDIIIGSSPLMLIHALWLCRQGHKILVLDRMPNIGGAWAISPVFCQPIYLSDEVWRSAFVEGACHLIEPIPRVYQVIENFSKVPFDVLEVQPVRLYNQRYIIPYSSWITLIASGFALVYGYLRSLIFSLIGFPNFFESYLNYRSKLLSFIRYQLFAVFGDNRIKGPRNGFANFIESLEHQCRSKGVDFIAVEVTSISRSGIGWHVFKDLSSSHYSARNIHLTSSTNLRLSGNGDFVSKPQRFSVKESWVVEICAENIQTLHNYVALWNDSFVVRISRILSPSINQIGANGCFQYLLESRYPNSNNLSTIALTEMFRKYLEKTLIIQPGRPFRIIGRVFCKYVSNVDQLPVGQIAPNAWIYSSNGNLATGIASWINQVNYSL